MKDNVYFLRNVQFPSFKIGKAVDVDRRISAIPQTIDRNLSFYVPCGDAIRVEKHLHYLFRQWRLPNQGGDGGTEWFHQDAFWSVLGYVEKHRELLEVGAIKPLYAQADGIPITVDRELLSRRTKEGLNRARENGKRLGRPAVSVNISSLRDMQNNGLSLRDIAAETGISLSTIMRSLKKVSNQ